MNIHRLFITGVLVLVFEPVSNGEVTVSAEHSAAGTEFRFKSVPAPANNDAATKAQFTLVDGERDRNGGELAVLHDGRVPTEEDQPSENFFFRAGTDGGRVQLDLGSIISVRRVSSYSWHANTRAPQIYTLHGADGTANGFSAAPKKGINPASCGSATGVWLNLHGQKRVHTYVNSEDYF